MIRRAVGAAWLALAAASCGHAIFTPPKGPGTAADGSAPWQSASGECRTARSYTAALRISGRAGTERIWPISVETAVTADRIYLDARFSGNPVFVLAGSATQATLWLRRDPQRVVKAPAGDIVEAILGLQISPERLLAVLSGCATRKTDVVSATNLEKMLAVKTSDALVYLQRTASGWQTRAAELEGLTVEFQWLKASVPDKLWIRSTPGREPRASLNVTVDDASLNEPPPASVFDAPAGASAAQPMTIDELRAAGPLRKKS